MDPFVVVSGDGICSRMNYLLYAYSYVYMNKNCKNIKVYWPKTKACDIYFEEIFNQSPKIQIIDKRNYKNFTSAEREIWKKMKDTSCFFGAGIYLNGKRSNRLCSPMEKIKAIKKIADLGFSEKVLSQKKYSFDKKIIGIHIRSLESRLYWSEDLDVKGNDRLNRLLKFYKKKIIENKEKKIFICSDSKKIEENFLKEFPDQVLTIEKEHPYHVENNKYQERNLNSNIDAIIDLLLLSECNYNDLIPVDGQYGYYTRYPKYFLGERFLNHPEFSKIYLD